MERPTVVTSTRLTPEERRLVEAGARVRGLKLSVYVRALLVAAARAALRDAAGP